MKEYQTTIGFIHWDEYGANVEDADDPIPPAMGDGWRLVSTNVSNVMRMSRMPIVWTWERDTP